MYLVVVFLIIWLLIGGGVLLVRRLPIFLKSKFYKGRISDMVKTGGLQGEVRFIPKVKYFNVNLDRYEEVLLEGEKLFVKLYKNGVVIWIIIDNNGKGHALVTKVMEQLIPVLMVVFGCLLLVNYLPNVASL